MSEWLMLDHFACFSHMHGRLSAVFNKYGCILCIYMYYILINVSQCKYNSNTLSLFKSKVCKLQQEATFGCKVCLDIFKYRFNF